MRCCNRGLLPLSDTEFTSSLGSLSPNMSRPGDTLQKVKIEWFLF